MNTTDKVQIGDSTAGTSTSTIYHCPYTQPKAEQGWECPRCGSINAPWVRQCECSGNVWTVTWAANQPNRWEQNWWEHVTYQNGNGDNTSTCERMK